MFIEQVGKSSGEIDGVREPLINEAGSSENYSVAAAIFPLASLLNCFCFTTSFGCSLILISAGIKLLAKYAIWVLRNCGKRK